MLKSKGKNKAQLLLDSSSSSESESEEVQIKNDKAKKKNKRKEEQGGLSINKDYAERYDNWRNKEEMQKLKDRLGVSDINELKDDESVSESSEEEVEWTPEQEKAFFKTFASLKMKDPTIYSKDFTGFFKKNEADEEDNEGQKKKKKDDNKKPFTVRDHERVMVLERGGQLSDDEEGDKVEIKKEPKSYNEELASIKNEFSKALNSIESSDDDDDEGGETMLGSNLLKKKRRTKEDKERDDEAQKKWLKGELEKLRDGKVSKEDTSQLQFLSKYWSDEKLDEGERFLRDYILNQKYIEPKDDEDYIPSYNEVVRDDDELSNDEKFEAEREEFEHKYNFRFEEPDQEFIKRYPRTIADSLRREDTKRKEQRQKAKERKEDLISKKKEEVQRLKAFKRKEIMDKIKKLHDITGDPNLALTEMDIDGDFDPEEYDRRMKKVFNDDYYQESDEEKPEFPFDEEIDGENDWEGEAWSLDESDDDASSNSKQAAKNIDAEPEAEEEEEPATSRSRGIRKKVQDELIEASKGKRGRRKRSAFLDALEREKPKFDPKIHKSFEQYFDEYYKLDFEDVVGDLKTRFKYHKTIPNDFGLTTEEILKADDRELNKWASLKKTFQYREHTEEEYEVHAYKQKSQKEQLKKRILLSVYDPTTGQSTGEQDAQDVGESQQQKKKKKRKKKNKGKSQNSDTSNNVTVTEDIVPVQSTKSNSPSKEQKSISNSSPKKQNNASESEAKTPSLLPDTPTGLSKRQRKNLKKKQTSANSDSLGEGNPQPKSTSVNDTIKPDFKSNSQKNLKSEKKKDKPNKKNLKRKANDSNDTNGMPVDEDRLRAYGLNPKKFMKRMKYGPGSKK